MVICLVVCAEKCFEYITYQTSVKCCYIRVVLKADKMVYVNIIAKCDGIQNMLYYHHMYIYS